VSSRSEPRAEVLVADDGVASCTVAELGRCVQITAAGELDLATLPLLREAAERAASPTGRTVVIDLCGVAFADTGVVHLAIGLDRRLRADAGELIVVAPPRIATLFAHAGADDLTLVEDAPRPPAGGPAR
jgi:anti-anti-sigma factor